MNGNEKSYEFVYCNCHHYLTLECTALSNVALNGIREFESNVMLLCSTCVYDNKRDSFFRNRNVVKVDKLNFGAELQKMEGKRTELVVKKVFEALKMTHDKSEKS